MTGWLSPHPGRVSPKLAPDGMEVPHLSAHGLQTGQSGPVLVFRVSGWWEMTLASLCQRRTGLEGYLHACLPVGTCGRQAQAARKDEEEIVVRLSSQESGLQEQVWHGEACRCKYD